MNEQFSSSAGDSLLDDLLERLTDVIHAGEPVDLDEICRSHPQLRDRLRELVPVVAALAFAGEPPPPASGPSAEDPLDSVSSAHAPQQLGDYRILRKLGQGGMGVVYEAEQISLQRRVALKVLPFAGAVDSRQLQRFRIESLAAAQLDHPGIVNVYGVGCDRGVHYYAMRLVEGRSLAELLAAPAEPEVDAETPPAASALTSARRNERQSYFQWTAEIGIQVADALDYAHQRGVVHRDIKPSNLLLDGDGRVWVTDFGLAQLELDAGLTRTGTLLGTPRYMSPEQAGDTPTVVDHRSDIYSLGITLYELLTLHPARDGLHASDVARSIREQEPTAPRKHDPQIPIELETIVLKAIAPEPGQRYQTARELADDLRRFREHRPIHARRAGLLDHIRKWCRRHRRLVTIGSLLTIALLISTLVVANVVRDQRRQSEYERSLRLLHEEHARQSAETVRQHRYVSEINLAAAAWETSRLGEMRDSLQRCLPREGESDLRGFEWHYLNALADSIPEPFGRHEGGVYNIRQSADGTIVATCGIDGVRFWDARTLETLGRLPGDHQEVNRISFSPDGRWMSTAADSGQVIIWETHSWRSERTFEYPSQVIAAEFSPDGKWLAVVERGGPPYPQGSNRITLLETATWETLVRFDGHSSAIKSLAVCDNSRLLATVAQQGECFIWNVESRQELKRLRQGDIVRSVAFFGTEPRLAIGTRDLLLFDLDPDHVQALSWLKGHSQAIESITEFRGKLMTASRDTTVRFWPAAVGAEGPIGPFTQLRHDVPLWCARGLADGRTVLTSAQDGSLRKWDLESENPQWCLRFPLTGFRDAAIEEKKLRAACVPTFDRSADGRLLLAATRNEGLLVWDAERDRELHSWTAETLASWGASAYGEPAVSLSPDSRWIALGHLHDGPLLIETASGQRRALHPRHRRLTSRVYWTPNGMEVVVVVDGQRAEIWDLQTGDVRSVGHAIRAACSPDGSLLATGGPDGLVRILDMRTGQEQAAFVADPSGVSDLTFSADGRVLAVAAFAGGVTLWNIATLRSLLSVSVDLPTHRDNNLFVRFSSDGRHLAALRWNRDAWEVLLWNSTPPAATGLGP